MSISTFGADDERAFLSTAVADPRQWRLCFALVGISGIVFATCVAYVRVPIRPSPAFVAAYNAASALADITTSIILFGQFNILRSRALLLLASGYLFASLICVVQLLTFPGTFTAAGLLGAQPQTALWLCVFWHGGFPLAVILYALSVGSGREIKSSSNCAISTAAGVVICAVLLCWSAATWGAKDARMLPALLDENGFTPWQRVVNLADIVLALTAFGSLWVRSKRSLLDLWLMVVMSYWLCDVSLSSYLNSGRYDLGFYAGRIYGVLAASFVLAVLVVENSRLYRRLAIAGGRLKNHAAELLRANEKLQSEIVQRQRAEEELRRAQVELAHLNQVTALGELTSALADEVNHPVGAMMINAETCLRWLSSELPNVEKARALADRIVKDGTRASETFVRMRQLFCKMSPLRDSVSVNNVIQDMIILLRGEAARAAVSIRADLMEDISQVVGNPAQLKLALMNLMVNGIEAMSEGDDPRELTIKSRRTADAHIVVCVSDTGSGLPPVAADQIFKAFFTTKPRRIGIGLSISRSIVEEHGGRLWASNNPSRGANFCLLLPVDRELSH